MNSTKIHNIDYMVVPSAVMHVFALVFRPYDGNEGNPGKINKIARETQGDAPKSRESEVLVG